MNNLDNISDDELDKIFREASEDGFPDNLQNEWPTMRERLERETPQTEAFLPKYRNLLWLLLLFIPAALVYFGGKSNAKDVLGIATTNAENRIQLNKDGKPYAVNEKQNRHLISEESKENKAEGINENYEAQPNESLKKNKELEVGKLSVMSKIVASCAKKDEEKTKELVDKKAENQASESAEKPKVFLNKTLELSQSKQNESQVNKIGNGPNGNLIFKKNSKSISQNQNKSSQETLGQVGQNRVGDNKNAIPKTDFLVNNLNATQSIPDSKNEIAAVSPLIINVNELKGIFGPFLISDSIKFDSTLAPNILVQKTTIEPINVDYFKKGFYIQIGFSPELSLVKEFDKETKVGNNQALLLNYRFSKKWSIQSGAMKSIKHYSAYPADYKWIWKNVNTPLKEIIATCRMIDIPLNVRYDFRSSPRRKMFASTGLTSYLMKKETYNYFYENDADPSIKWRQWNGKTGFYAAGVLNFSTGFEYKFTKKLSFQVEPFAKIPIKQIGFGKVKLSSYGILFSANYPLR
jgi:hypothetical protein